MHQQGCIDKQDRCGPYLCNIVMIGAEKLHLFMYLFSEHA